MNTDIEKRIDALENEVKTRNSKYDTFFHAIEKLLIPIALGILGYVASNASNQMASAQLSLAKAQELRSIKESETAKQIKYIELFYEDIRDNDPNRQLQALGLLLSLDQDVGRVLATAVKSNPSYSDKVKKEAQNILRSIQRYGPLINYKIGIYVDENQKQLVDFANKLKNAFDRDNFPGNVVVYAKPKDVMNKLGVLEYTQIRYEADYEEDAAVKLKALLQEINPKREYHLVQTLQPSQGFLSIFPVGSPDDFKINSTYGMHEEFVPSEPPSEQPSEQLLLQPPSISPSKMFNH